MKNPWERVPLSDYEAHMQLADIRQLQTLSEMMREQMKAYPARSAAVLGVAGGNGLCHLSDMPQIERLYGIDINEDYLEVCRERYSNLGKRLILEKKDLSNLNQRLPDVELIIANLFIEYIGVETFAKQLEKCGECWVSCVIQKNTDKEFVSHSPYENSFVEISNLHRDVLREELISALESAGFAKIWEGERELPNKKKFIRLDFRRTRA